MGFNYVKEMNAFLRWTETNQISNNAIVMWIKLFNIYNKRFFSGAITELEYIPITNLQLMAIAGLNNKPSLFKVRTELVEAGLLEYISGKKSSPGLYRVKFLSEKAPALDGEEDITEESYPLDSTLEENNELGDDNDNITTEDVAQVENIPFGSDVNDREADMNYLSFPPPPNVVKGGKSPPKNSCFHNFSQRNYDFKALEKMLINKKIE